MTNFIAVLCHNRTEYDSWLKSWVYLDDLQHFRFVDSVAKCRGVRFCKVVRLTGFEKLPDCEEIFHVAKSRIKE